MLFFMVNNTPDVLCCHTHLAICEVKAVLFKKRNREFRKVFEPRLVQLAILGSSGVRVWIKCRLAVEFITL